VIFSVPLAPLWFYPFAQVVSGPKPPIGSLVDRVVHGTLALSLVMAVNMAGQIATVPIAMLAWGAPRYGEWVALSALVGFLTLVDLGVQPHVVNQMTAAHARGDPDTFLAELHSAFRFQILLVTALLALGAAVLAILPLQRWYGIATASRIEVYLTVLFLGAELLIGVVVGPIGGAYRATGRLARGAFVGLIQRILFFGAQLGLMLAGAGFTVIAITRAALMLVITAWLLVDLRQTLPWFSMSPRALRGSLRAGLKMLGPASLFILTGLADYVTLQGTVLVVQTLAGGAEVTQLATQRTMVNMGRMIASQLPFVLWPEITAMSARGEHDKLLRVHRSMAKVVAFLVGALLFTLLPLGRTVYGWWTLRSLSFDPALYGIMAAQTIAWGVWGSSSTVLVATNRQSRLAKFLFANAAVTLALAALLVPRLGVRGAALAGLCADLAIMAWSAPRAACELTGDRPSAFAREVLGALFFGLALPAGFGALVYRLLPWTSARAVVAPAFGLAAGLVAFSLALAEPERAAARRVLDRLKARVSR
jgi:O-antigen/teichoic acid export membrane protein